MIERLLELDAVLKGTYTSDRTDLFSKNKNSVHLYNFFWRNTQEAETHLPTIVSGDTDSLSNLIADIATFHPDYSPISAYFHLFDSELGDIHQLLMRNDSRFKEQSIAKEDRKKSGAWIALSFAESATTTLANAESLQSISFSLCRRSLAFSIARSLHLYPQYPITNLSEKWEKMRNISQMPVMEGMKENILRAAGLLSSSNSNSDPIHYEYSDLFSVLKDFAKGKASISSISDQFCKIYPDISDHIISFRKSFDNRIDAFNYIIQDILSSTHERDICSMAIGHFANLLLPGSLSHIKLVARYEVFCPGSIIWYGFFGGMSPDFAPERSLGGLGRKLLRDLYATFDPFSPPTADISLSELEALSRLRITGEMIKPVHQKASFVSLLPGVDVMSRFPDNDSNENKDSNEILKKSIIEKEKSEKLRRLLKEALSIIDESFNDTSSKTLSTPIRKKKKTQSQKENNDL